MVAPTCIRAGVEAGMAARSAVARVASSAPPDARSGSGSPSSSRVGGRCSFTYFVVGGAFDTLPGFEGLPGLDRTPSGLGGSAAAEIRSSRSRSVSASAAVTHGGTRHATRSMLRTTIATKPRADMRSPTERGPSATLRSDELLDAHADVACDLSKECRRDIASRVERHRRDATVVVPELLVKSALGHFGEPEAFEDGHDLPRAEDREIASHAQAT
jgi:hypothetical protein